MSEEFTQNPEVFTRQYEAAIKRAIASGNTPYTPGALARAYNQVTKQQRESVNQETNRIFQKQTGVMRKLEQSNKDLRLRRQWLRIRDIVVARRFELYGKKTDLSHRWAVYQVDMNKRMFEIDVEDRNSQAPVIQPHVTRLIFSRGTVPAGFTLTMESFGSFDRWRVTWDSNARLTGNLNWQFVNVVLFPGSFGSEWRSKSQRDRLARQKEVQRQMRVLRTPLKQLGGRTPLEVMSLPPGNYEVKGQGFMTVWNDYIYYQRLSDHKDTNEALRWFLRRHVILPMATTLNSRQQSGLLKQALVASVLTMRGGAKLRNYGGSSPTLTGQAKTLGGIAANKSLEELASDQTKVKKGKADLLSIVSDKVQTPREKDAQDTVNRLARSKRTDGLKLLYPVR